MEIPNAHAECRVASPATRWLMNTRRPSARRVVSTLDAPCEVSAANTRHLHPRGVHGARGEPDAVPVNTDDSTAAVPPSAWTRRGSHLWDGVKAGRPEMTPPHSAAHSIHVMERNARVAPCPALLHRSARDRREASPSAATGRVARDCSPSLKASKRGAWWLGTHQPLATSAVDGISPMHQVRHGNLIEIRRHLPILNADPPGCATRDAGTGSEPTHASSTALLPTRPRFPSPD
jgi:hypothetical protein